MNENKKCFSKIGINYLIFAVSAIVIQIIILNALTLANINVLNDFNTLTIITAVCSYVLPFPILVYLMKKIEAERLEKQTLNMTTFIRYIAVTLS